ncbi:MAG: MBG domain-containing protein, partial [Oscillospiraceae bacterium]
NGTVYEDISGNKAPKDAGMYRLIVGLDSENSTGRKEIYFEISQKALIVKAEDKETYQYYDLPTATVAFDGFVDGEDKSVLKVTASDKAFEASHTVADTKNAGKFVIDVSGEATADNYDVTTQNGTLTIIEKKMSPPAKEVIEPSATEPTVGIPKDSLPEDVEAKDVSLVVYETTKEDSKKLDDEIKEEQSKFANKVNLEISLVNIAKNNSVVSQKGKITICIPYPKDTDSRDNFSIMHLIGGTTKEMITPEKIAEGLKFDVESLSPFAIGWTKATNGGGGSSSGGHSSNNEQYDFWESVADKIAKADKGDTIKVNAKFYDKMPTIVMKALEKNFVTLVIEWNNGETITIPEGKAYKQEDNRIYYPLSFLQEYYGRVEETVSEDNKVKEIEETVGVIKITAPAQAEVEATATPTQNGVMSDEIQKETQTDKASIETYSAVIEDETSNSGINPVIFASVVAVCAVIAGGAIVWKKKQKN